MNLNPLSPFSNKPLSDISAREGDAWCYFLLNPNRWEHEWDAWKNGHHMMVVSPHYHSDWAAAGPLIERVEWPDTFELTRGTPGWCIYNVEWFNSDDFESKMVTRDDTSPTLAIRNAFIIAATHAKEQQS